MLLFLIIINCFGGYLSNYIDADIANWYEFSDETNTAERPLEIANYNKWCQSWYIFLNPFLLMYCVINIYD